MCKTIQIILFSTEVSCLGLAWRWVNNASNFNQLSYLHMCICERKSKRVKCAHRICSVFTKSPWQHFHGLVNQTILFPGRSTSISGWKALGSLKSLWIRNRTCVRSDHIIKSRCWTFPYIFVRVQACVCVCVCIWPALPPPPPPSPNPGYSLSCFWLMICAPRQTAGVPFLASCKKYLPTPRPN